MTSEDNRRPGVCNDVNGAIEDPTDWATVRPGDPDPMNAAEMLAQLDGWGDVASAQPLLGAQPSGWFGWAIGGDVLTVWFRQRFDDGSASSEPVVRTWRLVPTVAMPETAPVPEPWASVVIGGRHPVDGCRAGARTCVRRFTEDGLIDESDDDPRGWVCTRDVHADPLHVATTGPHGIVCALYNAATHEYQRRAQS